MLGTVLGGGPLGQYGSYPRIEVPPNSYALLIDWNGAGDFGNSYSNVSRYLLDVQFERGRDVYDPLTGRAQAGKLTAVLDNRSGLFSSQNTTGSLYGKLLPLRKVQFRTVYGTRWTGYVNSYSPGFGFAGGQWIPTVTVKAAGPFFLLADKKVNPPADAGSLTGTIVGKILDAAGWSAGARSIEAGQSTTSRWFESDIDAMTALRRVEDTELGFLYEDESGNVVFEDRAHRRTGARLISQAIYSDIPYPGFFPYTNVVQEDPLPYIVNEVIANSTPYVVQSLAVLWTLVPSGSGLSNPTLAPGQSLTWFANYPDPNGPSIQTVGGVNLSGVYVDAWTTPVSGTDYTVTGVALSDLAVTVSKFATAMKITVQNNHATNTATLTLLQARGTPVTKGTASSVNSIDATSQTTYGARTFRTPAPWLQNTSAAQSYADFIIAAHKDPRTLLQLTFLANMTPAILQELMGRRISDRVSVWAGQARTALIFFLDFFVEYIKDHYDVQNDRYEVTLGLSQVGPESTSGGWTLGTSALDSTTILSF